jgi:hypothetical protein
LRTLISGLTLHRKRDEEFLQQVDSSRALRNGWRLNVTDPDSLREVLVRAADTDRATEVREERERGVQGYLRSAGPVFQSAFDDQTEFVGQGG